MILSQRLQYLLFLASLGFIISLFPMKYVGLAGSIAFLLFGVSWSYQEIAYGTSWSSKLIGALSIVAIGAYLYVRFAFFK